jgi:hypothetical protein
VDVDVDVVGDVSPNVGDGAHGGLVAAQDDVDGVVAVLDDGSPIWAWRARSRAACCATRLGGTQP